MNEHKLGEKWTQVQKRSYSYPVFNIFQERKQQEGIVTPPILLVSTYTGRRTIRSVRLFSFSLSPRPQHFVAVSRFDRKPMQGFYLDKTRQ